MSELRLKLLSLAMALALLVVIRGKRRVPYALVVPVEVRLPEGVALASPLPATLRVSVSGPWARLRSLEPADVGPVAIDLSRTSPGAASWFARPETLRLPAGVHVESMSPAQGAVELRPDAP